MHSNHVSRRVDAQVPLWVWIAWIPQLLVSLQRPESLHCKRILTLLALSYPQARPRRCACSHTRHELYQLVWSHASLSARVALLHP